MTAPAKSPVGTDWSSPLGATVSAEGVNFSVYSRSASGLALAFFDKDDDLTFARAHDPEALIPPQIG